VSGLFSFSQLTLSLPRERKPTKHPVGDRLEMVLWVHPVSHSCDPPDVHDVATEPTREKGG